MKKTISIVSLLWLVLFNTEMAGAGGAPWRNHAPPYQFLFGNEIDTHQQTRLQPDGDLFGFLYITYTGEFSADGIPKAMHCDKNTPASKCVVGWIIRGKKGQATFLYHHNDHPIWLADRADIPQPGAFSHFHWLGAPEGADGLMYGDRFEGYFIELMATETFIFLHHDQEIPIRPGIDIATHVNIVGSFSSGDH